MELAEGTRYLGMVALREQHWQAEWQRIKQENERQSKVVVYYPSYNLSACNPYTTAVEIDALSRA